MSNNKIPPMPVLLEDLGMLFPNETSKQKARYGIFKCQCGNEFKAQTTRVYRGYTHSCGCFNVQRIRETQTKHGLATHRLYNTWAQMINRTSNTKASDFKHYGGRGIVVCNRWNDIHLFIEDMEPTYIEGLTIDRIDVNGNYEPSNCRWTTKDVQARNTILIRSNNTSGYKGISFDNRVKRWRSQIQVSRARIHIGSFGSALDAAKAYDKYVIDNNLEHTLNFKQKDMT